MMKSIQISSAKSLEKYGILAIYDKYVNKRYTIDHEDIHYQNKYAGH